MYYSLNFLAANSIVLANLGMQYALWALWIFSIPLGGPKRKLSTTFFSTKTSKAVLTFGGGTYVDAPGGPPPPPAGFGLAPNNLIYWRILKLLLYNKWVFTFIFNGE